MAVGKRGGALVVIEVIDESMNLDLMNNIK